MGIRIRRLIRLLRIWRIHSIQKSLFSSLELRNHSLEDGIKVFMPQVAVAVLVILKLRASRGMTGWLEW